MKLTIHYQTVAVLGVLVIIIGCSNNDAIVNAIRLKNYHWVSVLASTTARNSNQLLLLKMPRGGGGSGSTSTSNISVISDVTLPYELSGGEIETSAVRDSIATTSNSDSSLSSSSSLSPVQSSPSPSPSEDLAMKSAKWNGLRIRILSTIGIVSSLIGLSYFFREDGLSVFVVVLQVMMYREMSRTIGGSGDDDWDSSVLTKIRKYSWLAIAIVAFNGPKLYPWKRTMLEAITFTMIISIGLITSILDFQYNKRNNGTAIEFREYIQQTAVSLLSAVLVVLPSSYWIGTLEEYGMKWIFFPATFVAINDIMAYVFGKLFGKHPLLSSISPNKTWEGFIGAAIATAGTAWVTLAQQQSSSSSSSPLIGPGSTGVTRFDGMVVAIFSSLIAPFAGFLASVIKRAYGRKDFGTLLPGHGGVVDRLDCQLILAPFVYFYLSLFKFAAATTTTS